MSRQQDWITENYNNIIQWAKNMTKSDELSSELAHYGIEVLLHHKRYQEILDKHNADPSYGHLRGFLLAILRNSWYGKKSHFSRYHKAHRCDIGSRKREITDEAFDILLDVPTVEYDHEQDRLIEGIEGILEEMSLDQDKLWYSAKLFQMYLEDSNYSSLSRKTDIPRTSISNAVQEAKTYILQELRNRKII